MRLEDYVQEYKLKGCIYASSVRIGQNKDDWNTKYKKKGIRTTDEQRLLRVVT